MVRKPGEFHGDWIYTFRRRQEETDTLSRFHLWDDPYLLKVCADGLLRHCIPLCETRKILERCHSSPYGGQYGAFRTHAKVWQSGFFWPNMYRDPKEFMRRCPR